MFSIYVCLWIRYSKFNGYLNMWWKDLVFKLFWICRLVNSLNRWPLHTPTPTSAPPPPFSRISEECDDALYSKLGSSHSPYHSCNRSENVIIPSHIDFAVIGFYVCMYVCGVNGVWWSEMKRDIDSHRYCWKMFSNFWFTNFTYVYVLYQKQSNRNRCIIIKKPLPVN